MTVELSLGPGQPRVAAALGRKPVLEPPHRDAPGPQKRQGHLCCFKPRSSGVVCLAVTDDLHGLTQKELCASRSSFRKVKQLLPQSLSKPFPPLSGTGRPAYPRPVPASERGEARNLLPGPLSVVSAPDVG